MSVLNAMQAIAEPTRFEILRLVSEQELRAGQIAENFDVTRTAISQHLTILRDAGLISERRQGTRRLYQLRPEGFEPIQEVLSAFWNPKLQRLKQIAEQEERNKRK